MFILKGIQRLILVRAINKKGSNVSVNNLLENVTHWESVNAEFDFIFQNIY